MRGKYVYIPIDTLVFKEYAIFSDFWKVTGKTRWIKPLTYVEFQMMRKYYSFDELIDVVTELCIKEHWKQYESLYMALNELNTKEEIFYERNNKGSYRIKSKLVHHRKSKRKTVHRKKQLNEAIRTVFFKAMR